MTGKTFLRGSPLPDDGGAFFAAQTSAVRSKSWRRHELNRTRSAWVPARCNAYGGGRSNEARRRTVHSEARLEPAGR